MSLALKDIKPLKKIDAPIWLSKLFESIDKLDFSEGSGFDCLSNDIVMQFGQDQTVGLDNVKAFFKKIDEPFFTEHFIFDVYHVANAYFMYGGASIEARTENAEQIFVPTLFNILWLDDDGKVERYVVDYPPEMEKMK